MSAGGSRARLLPLAGLLLLWGAAFAMACRLKASAISGPAGRDDSAAARFLGAGREALGHSFFDEADTYFHLGVGHVRHEALSNTLFQTWGKAIQPSGHEHAAGHDVREILPWMRLATDMDPHNVDAYLTTAFWVATAIRRPDVAESILLEAQRENPRDYRILNERARLLFGKEDDVQAAALLDAALQLWPGALDPSDRQSQLDLAQMCSYRGFLYDMRGEREKALELFRKALLVSPDNKALAARVKALEAGQDLSARDRVVWEQLFAKKHTCAREGDAHEHHEHTHEHHEHDEHETH